MGFLKNLKVKPSRKILKDTINQSTLALGQKKLERSEPQSERREQGIQRKELPTRLGETTENVRKTQSEAVTLRKKDTTSAQEDSSTQDRWWESRSQAQNRNRIVPLMESEPPDLLGDITEEPMSPPKLPVNPITTANATITNRMVLLENKSPTQDFSNLRRDNQRFEELKESLRLEARDLKSKVTEMRALEIKCKRFSQECSSLTKQKQEMERTFQSRNTELIELKNKSANEKRRFEEELRTEKNRHAVELRRTTANFEYATMELRGDASHREGILETEKQLLRDDHQRDLKRAKDEHQSTQRALEQRNDQEKHRIESMHATEIRNLQTQHGEEIEILKTLHNREISMVNSSSNQAIAVLTTERDTLKLSASPGLFNTITLRKSLTDLQTRNNKQKTIITDLESKISNLQSSIADTSTLKKLYENSLLQCERLESENESLRVFAGEEDREKEKLRGQVDVWRGRYVFVKERLFDVELTEGNGEGG